MHIINFRMEYSDEAGNDPIVGEGTDISNQDSKKAYIIQSYSVKRIIIEGVTFSTVEFSSKARTFSRSVISQSQIEDGTEEKEESFLTMFERNSLNDIAKEKEIMPNRNSHNNNLDGYRHIILFGKVSSVQEVRNNVMKNKNSLI